MMWQKEWCERKNDIKQKNVLREEWCIYSGGKECMLCATKNDERSDVMENDRMRKKDERG